MILMRVRLRVRAARMAQIPNGAGVAAIDVTRFHPDTKATPPRNLQREYAASKIYYLANAYRAGEAGFFPSTCCGRGAALRRCCGDVFVAEDAEPVCVCLCVCVRVCVCVRACVRLGVLVEDTCS